MPPDAPDATRVWLIRTELDRIVVREDYARIIEDQHHGCLDALLFVPGDRIRDVTEATAQLWPGERWWSRAAAEEAARRVPLVRSSAPQNRIARQKFA